MSAMKLEIHSKRAVLTTVLWLVGVGTISWITPERPHVGWQPPQDEVFCGFLQDSKTLVTATRNKSPELSGPIRLRSMYKLASSYRALGRHTDALKLCRQTRRHMGKTEAYRRP
jgi:hypothetical protein